MGKSQSIPNSKKAHPARRIQTGNLTKNRINEDATKCFCPMGKTVSSIQIRSTAAQNKCTYCTGTLDIIYTLDSEKYI